MTVSNAIFNMIVKICWLGVAVVFKKKTNNDLPYITDCLLACGNTCITASLPHHYRIITHHFTITDDFGT